MPGDVKMSLERVKGRLDVYAKLNKRKRRKALIENTPEIWRRKKDKKEKER